MDPNKTIRNGLDDKKASKAKGELPPTPDDAKMSVRHHKDSIAYNLRHSTDHGKAMIDHVARMRDVAGAKAAAAQARKAHKVLTQMQQQLQPYLSSNVTKNVNGGPTSN